MLTVDENGLVTAIADGSATITATLEQNPTYSAEFTVTATETVDGVKFTTTVPQSLGAFESAQISAAYFEDGAETPDALTWLLSGADDTAFSYAVAADGKSISIDCFGYAVTPLTVKAYHGAESVSARITLEGI